MLAFMLDVMTRLVERGDVNVWRGGYTNLRTTD